MLECPIETIQDDNNFVCWKKNVLNISNTLLIYLIGFLILFLFSLGSFFNKNIYKNLKKGTDNNSNGSNMKFIDLNSNNESK